MRLLIHVEGETEETFVNEVLAPHLCNRGYDKVGARMMGNSRLRHRRGGIRAWSTVRADIIRHLREDTKAIATTFVDYYGLPRTGENAWPGRDQASSLSFSEKAIFIENALKLDLSALMGNTFDKARFIPFVMIHEFEGLLFSDCGAFSRAIGKPDLQIAFQRIRDQFQTPEEINDSPITAPSKRVLDLVSHYEKPLFGTLAILAIGLETLRRQCPHFNDWLNTLEQSIQSVVRS